MGDAAAGAMEMKSVPMITFISIAIQTINTANKIIEKIESSEDRMMRKPTQAAGKNHRLMGRDGQGRLQGFEAECPFCDKTNQAIYHRETSELVWWVNPELGMWCQHARGVYSAGGIECYFIFEGFYRESLVNTVLSLVF